MVTRSLRYTGTSMTQLAETLKLELCLWELCPLQRADVDVFDIQLADQVHRLFQVDRVIQGPSLAAATPNLRAPALLRLVHADQGRQVR